MSLRLKRAAARLRVLFGATRPLPKPKRRRQPSLTLDVVARAAGIDLPFPEVGKLVDVGTKAQKQGKKTARR